MKKPDDKRSHGHSRATDPSDFENAIGDTFRSLIENAFDVVKIVDSGGIVKYVSPSIKHVLGYEPRELVGQDVLDYIHPDDRSKARNVLRFVLETGGRSPYVELRARHKDGSWRYVETVTQNLVDHPVIGGIVVNYRDVTERKRADEALRRSEERFHKAFNSSPDSITISLLKDGRFLEVNPSFEELSGYPRSEIVNRSALDLRLWADPAKRDELIDILRRHHVARDFTADFTTKSGALRTCLLSAEIVEFDGEPCMLAVTRDITERQRAEAQLRRASEQLRADHEQLKEKNIALKQILNHMEEEKMQYRHEVSARAENLLAPIISTLKRTGGMLSERDVERLEKGLARIIEDDIDHFQNSLAKLTPREQDICKLLKRGLSSKEIAERLGVSPQTIHKHRQEIRRKLQLTNKEINLTAYLRSK